MHVENLIKMANQIGGFFEAMPDRAEALTDIASHIKRFWEPRMRRALLAHVDATAGGEGLDPIVREAIATHRAKLEVAPAPAPVSVTS
ncbi:formate dehydrogenase subunit delta [Cupriavidus plantarum]|uniref:formate dehydrogenase subunit delta n=1 Tax=Cupriavidus plantarum TaxID=942865 RepID=UPI000EB5AE18|nr:formate dehydrogenase subunit delta [Cupriavidus plantarum]RLK35557.1 formate dehydrogenase delta subunit [Cupriavidus plantarum]